MNLPDTLVAEVVVFLQKMQQEDEAKTILQKLKKVIARANQDRAALLRDEDQLRELAQQEGLADPLPEGWPEHAADLARARQDRNRRG